MIPGFPNIVLQGTELTFGVSWYYYNFCIKQNKTNILKI